MNETTRFIYESAYGSVEFALESNFWISEIDGVSSIDIDISDSRSIRQIGANIADQSVQPRIVTVDGTIYAPLRLNRRRLLDVIAPQAPATLTVIQDTESWYLDVVPQKTPAISPGNGLQEFQMELYAAYPYWRTTASAATQIAGIIPMFKFPFFTGGSWWISQFDSSYFNTVTNSGNVPIEFQVIFTARSTVVNPEIYHMGTQQKLALRNKTMATGERIVINTVDGNRGVTVIAPNGVVTNGYKFLTVDSDIDMTLFPGENLLRIDAESNREGLNARVEFAEGVRSGV